MKYKSIVVTQRGGLETVQIMGEEIYQVPAGKRLVIEHVTVNASDKNHFHK